MVSVEYSIVRKNENSGLARRTLCGDRARGVLKREECELWVGRMCRALKHEATCEFCLSAKRGSVVENGGGG